jgi:hypothetical protein
MYKAGEFTKEKDLNTIDTNDEEETVKDEG